MFGLTSGWKWIAASVALIGLTSAVAWWHHDIESAVYQRVYASQIRQALKEKHEEIDRLTRINKLAQASVVQAQQESASLQQTNDQLRARIGKLTGNISRGWDRP